ncbi:MAG: C40 family peptidase [Lachnospiraceae bacterium]|nr:peptidoglycan endopeptidase [Clostridiales bacterium]
MTNKLFRTLKITCLCMALTAALPIVSFADEQTAAVKEDKMVVKIIHLDENGNPLEADKQTETETAKEETESSEKTTDTEEADADTEEAEADPDEDEAEEEEAVEEIEAAIEVENDLRSEIVTYALQFVGNRYKYGGTNPNTGVDCSGFTSYVMRHAAGVELPHSSGGQSRMGRVVSSSEMRPGDIISYGSGKRINHVALYIGNGQIVHASTEKTGIKVSRWNYRTPVRIVNVLGD